MPWQCDVVYLRDIDYRQGADRPPAVCKSKVALLPTSLASFFDCHSSRPALSNLPAHKQIDLYNGCHRAYDSEPAPGPQVGNGFILPGVSRALTRKPSHAHEEDIPGTVNLQARGQNNSSARPINIQQMQEQTNTDFARIEGDDTGYGQALFPVPAEDPNDPLQVGDTRPN